MELTEKDVVDFGNYILSVERKAITSELNQDSVTHADWCNFFYGDGKVKCLKS